MNHETEQEIIKTDDGFSETKMAIKLEQIIIQTVKNVQKTKKKVQQQDNVIYEEK